MNVVLITESLQLGLFETVWIQHMQLIIKSENISFDTWVFRIGDLW